MFSWIIQFILILVTAGLAIAGALFNATKERDGKKTNTWKHLTVPGKWLLIFLIVSLLLQIGNFGSQRIKEVRKENDQILKDSILELRRIGDSITISKLKQNSDTSIMSLSNVKGQIADISKLADSLGITLRELIKFSSSFENSFNNLEYSVTDLNLIVEYHVHVLKSKKDMNLQTFHFATQNISADLRLNFKNISGFLEYHGIKTAVVEINKLDTNLALVKMNLNMKLDRSDGVTNLRNLDEGFGNLRLFNMNRDSLITTNPIQIEIQDSRSRFYKVVFSDSLITPFEHRIHIKSVEKGVYRELGPLVISTVQNKGQTRDGKIID